MAGPFVYRPPRTPVYYPQESVRPGPAQYNVYTPRSNYPFDPDLRLPQGFARPDPAQYNVYTPRSNYPFNPDLRLPQEFARPDPAQYNVYTPRSNYPFNPDLRLPHDFPSHSGTHHRHPIPLAAASTPGGHNPPNLHPEGRGRSRWTPPPGRSRSVPAEHGRQWLQDPPRQGRRRRRSPSRQGQGPRVNDRAPNPSDAGQRGRPVNAVHSEQWLQDPPRHPNGERHGRPRSSSALRGQGPRDHGHSGNPFNAGGRPARDPPFYINPWINAHSPRTEFIFDLSPSEYAPRMYQSGRLVRLPNADLRQTATHPPSTRMQILIEAIPQWPCDVLPRSMRVPQGAISHITLRDVLRNLHKHLHQPISHSDWNALRSDRQQMVMEAFTRRCRRYPDMLQEWNKGVKRVDFLLGKTRMIGLRLVGRRDGREMMKLVVGPVPN